jgi:hypothetical protein
MPCTSSSTTKLISEIDLRELGLAIEAQVLVAEAAHDLEVAVEARDHDSCLKICGALGERVELARG